MYLNLVFSLANPSHVYLIIRPAERTSRAEESFFLLHCLKGKVREVPRSVWTLWPYGQAQPWDGTETVLSAGELFGPALHGDYKHLYKMADYFSIRGQASSCILQNGSPLGEHFQKWPLPKPTTSDPVLGLFRGRLWQHHQALLSPLPVQTEHPTWCMVMI